ncbi:MAG: methionine aminotransferase [Bacteroidota bacterium]|nr:methionine aminotransferase [Bacteroidota bacterium]
MLQFEERIVSKLPNAGTSIFAVMSKLAADHKAINLSQGFPDFDVSPGLIERVHHYMKEGHNQYAPMTGTRIIRERIAKKAKDMHGAGYDPETEINITAGATQAIYTAISCIIRDEDEAIIFEPAYDSYAPSVILNGGTVKYSRLSTPGFRINWEELTGMISHRTKMIIINTPHNPTGSILSGDDMQKLEQLTRNTNIIILSDEVYEHLIFDGKEHESVCKYPGLARRSFAIGSFGKTFHATGWKMGYVLAPENLMTEFRKAHQFVVFACNTPVQMAIADFLKYKKNYNQVGKMYQKKRNYFVRQLKKSRFRIIPSYGTYFQLLDYSDITGEGDMEFAKRLIKIHGIASIPLSPFYHNRHDPKMLRFCFAKKEETLKQAAEILCRI